MKIKVLIARVGDVDVPMPSYQTEGAAGLDLSAAVEEPVRIMPGKRALIRTGWSFAIPPGFEGQVRPRSGLALRYGVTVLNAPGTIDSDYRGEIGVVLANFGDDVFLVERGDRIAQFVIAPVTAAAFDVVPSLDTTARGAGGYGSTGQSDARREPGKVRWTCCGHAHVDRFCGHVEGHGETAVRCTCDEPSFSVAR